MCEYVKLLCIRKIVFIMLKRVSFHYETFLVGRVRHFYVDVFGGDERVQPLLVHHETGSIVVLRHRSFFRLSRSVVEPITIKYENGYY